LGIFNDWKHSTDTEDRWDVIGKVDDALFVVYTERNDRTRIISARKATKTEDCPAMTAEALKEFRPWYAKNKRPVTINLDNGAILYFKSLAEETSISYWNLINLYLVQCAKEKKRPAFV